MDVLDGHGSILDDYAKPQSPELQSRRKANDYWVGLALLLIVVLLWTASGFIMQVGEDQFRGDLRYSVTVIGAVRQWLR